MQWMVWNGKTGWWLTVAVNERSTGASGMVVENSRLMVWVQLSLQALGERKWQLINDKERGWVWIHFDEMQWMWWMKMIGEKCWWIVANANELFYKYDIWWWMVTNVITRWWNVWLMVTNADKQWWKELRIDKPK